MWQCPTCARSFANKSQWHSCHDLSVADHLADKTPEAVALYHEVVAALEACGRFRVHPQKTRISFISRMTFAGVRLGTRWVDLSMILPSPVYDDRVRRLELFGPTSWAMSFRLAKPEDLDESIRAYLCEALRRGDQETLDPRASVEPVTGRLLEVFKAAFRAKVNVVESAVTVPIPSYVADALALVDEAVVRIGGMETESVIHRENARSIFMISEDLGLGAGDEVDVLVRVI